MGLSEGKIKMAAMNIDCLDEIDFSTPIHLDGMSYSECDKIMRAYSEAVKRRERIVSANRSRQMKGKSRLNVPPKPIRPLIPILYDDQGEWQGRIFDTNEEVPEGWEVRWEPILS